MHSPSLFAFAANFRLNLIKRVAILGVILISGPVAQAGFDVSGSGLPPNQDLPFPGIPGHTIDSSGNIQGLGVMVYGVDGSGSFYHPGCVWETLPCDDTITWVPDGTVTVNDTVYQATSAVLKSQVDPAAPWRCITDCSEATIFVTASSASAPTPTPPQIAGKPNDRTGGGSGDDGKDENSTVGGSRDDGCSHGMARYSSDLLTASLRITDTPLEYFPPVGAKIDFIVAYHQLDDGQSPTQQYSNLGPNWTFNWMSYVTDDPANSSSNVNVYVRGGGSETYSGFNSNSQSFDPDSQTHAVLVRTSSTSYEKRFRDGSKQIFAQPNGAAIYPRLIFMTQAVDAFGNTVLIHYDANFRIDTITDALGQITVFSYELAGDANKITKVTDPFGRYVVLNYTDGKLTSTTDPVGITSQFSYQSGTNFINALTTPYGTVNFATGQSSTNRWLNITDSTGAVERIEYRDNAPGIGSTDSPLPSETGFDNGYLNLRNSFYWDKTALSMYPPVDGVYNYTKARITHWLLSTDGTTPVAVASSEKMPLESRVWYTYPNQPSTTRIGPVAQPAQIARVLDDGSTQTYFYEYNSLGNMTKSTDSVDREFTNVYDTNGIDLLEKRQTREGNNELLASFTYNAQHLPLIATDAARQTTIYTYNDRGQRLTSQNAKGEITSWTYGGSAPDGYLASIASPSFNGSSAVTSYTYDSAKRVRTVTDTDGYAVTTDYDNLDRPTQVTYPDETNQQFEYSQDFGQGVVPILDLTKSKDRRGRWTTRHYNSNHQMDSMTDPLNRTTQYGWCSCGALTSITDARSKTTIFNRDLQNRVYQKVFADAKSISYVYENRTSRLKSMTDSKNQTTNYQYFRDNETKQISYTNAQIATPTVSFTYNPNYDRMATMTDGTGTTTYSYYPITSTPTLGAGQLQSIDGPLVDDTITYSYDELGRELNHAVNEITSSRIYDSLGRISSVTNPLGVFTYGYVGVTSRLQNTSVPNGQSVAYSYFPNLGDKRLQTIQNNAVGSSILSKFDYTYDANGQITQLTRQLGPTDYPKRWFGSTGSMGDDADQLITLTEQQADDVYANTAFEYDASGNRTDFGTFSYNDVNQLTNTGYSYDANGNLTADPFRTYEWDAANRLTAINYTALGGRTEFTYDGLGRRVKIVEKNPGMTMTVQAPNTSYTNFSSPSFALGAGTYTLAIQGLNPNGGDNTMFVDAIELNGAMVPNGGFETPDLGSGGYAYGPSNATWTFQGYAGMSNNGSGFTSGNPNAPEGNQVAVVQMNGIISQSLTLSGGTYTLSLYGAQRGNWQSSYQAIQISIQAAAPIASTKQFIWNGNAIAEERDANNDVTRRFYSQGEQINGASYYYTRDHLGSVRELTDTTGAIRARYDYNPYGSRTKISGDLDASFGYTGHYFHAPSSMNLALNRAYDSITGRWLSRDPSGEAGGLNLYDYVTNNPLNLADPLGLCPGDFWDLLYQFMLGAEEGAYATIDSAIPFWDPFSDRYNPNDPGIWFSQDVGGPALQFLATAGVGEAISALRSGEATFSLYEDITEGNSVINRATNVTPTAFESNLMDAGYLRSVSQDGAATILQEDGVQYVIRGSPTSGPTVDFYPAGSSSPQIKIRLGR